MPQLSPDLVINGRYQLQRPVGRGGFSVVWLAVDLELTKPVALKISLPDKDPGGEQPVRMEHQHETTRHLRHPHLLCSHEFFMVENAGCLVFDYMANGTLHQRIRSKGTLEESEIAKMILQIGDALHFLHGHSLVHFDVKPENVLIDAKGDYYLSDFDTASRMENSMVRVSRIYADTPQYRSPEHLRGAAELSEKIDIFAFGTTLFETCEGIMEKEYGIGMMLLSGAEKPGFAGTKYSKRLENLVHACWNHNPAERPSADALVAYAAHMLEKNFWPPIAEYNPNDKPIADLPQSRGAETARITVGRPTVAQTPTPEPETRATISREETPPPPQPTLSPFQKESKAASAEAPPVSPPPSFTPPPVAPPMYDTPKSEPNYAKYGVIGLLLLALLGGGGYFANRMIQMRKLDAMMERAAALTQENQLKAAYDEMVTACKLFPDNEAAKKQRLNILAMALNLHRNDIDQVKQAIGFNETERYAELCQLLEAHKENVSILVLDDSTAYYQSLIPNCLESLGGSSSDTPGTDTGAEPVQETQQPGGAATSETTSGDGTPAQQPGTKPAPATQNPTATPTPVVDDAFAQEMKRLKEEQARDDKEWKTAKTAHKIETYQNYLNNWPQGRHAGEANSAIEALKKAAAPPPVTATPAPPKVDDNGPAYLSKSAVTGLPLSEREQSCRRLSEGGAIRLTPSTFVELAEFTLYSDSPGKVVVTLKDETGKKIGSVRCVVSNGRTQCSLTDLDARLKPGKTYTLDIAPLRNDKGALPLLENMKDCSPNFFPDAKLKVDYQGNFMVFDLKYSY